MAQIPIKIYGINSIKRTPANYRLLYYLSNEFSNPTKEEQRYAIATGGWSATNLNNVQYWLTSSVRGFFSANGFITANNINTDSYTKIFIKGTAYKARHNSGPVATRWSSLGTSYNVSVTNINNRLFYEELGSSTFTKTTNYNLSNTAMSNLNLPILLAAGLNATTNVNNTHSANDKNSNNLFVRCGETSSGTGQIYSQLTIYAVGFVKADDISGLSAYGSDIATILNNSANLFQDERALRYMVNNCTGDFMISALTNTTFLTQLRDSSNVNTEIVKADEDWARFIALINM